jgi:DNA-binding response OmpR family regulator
VLVVEDDGPLREAIGLVVAADGMDCSPAATAEQALASFAPEPADLILLDLMLPGRDGFDVCRAIRSISNVPIIIVTAIADRAAIVRGLELGADDYVTKPFETDVLLARVHAVLRRTTSEDRRPSVAHGVLVIDFPGHRATCRGTDLALTPTEFSLLAELARHPGQALTREELLQLVWGYDYLGDSRLVDMAVKRLRDKIADVCDDEPVITTVRGVGYRFEAP